MDIKPIDKTLSVSGQIRPDDVASLKRQGFRAIICNRPDGEAGDQPTFDEIEREAEKLGLKARHVPIVAGKVSDEASDAFAATLRALPGPVLAYCRTGTRSAALWAQMDTKARKLPIGGG